MRTFGDSISVQELQPYADWCKRHDIIIDESDPAAYQNAQVVAEYFINTWKENISEQNLEGAFPYLQPHLKFVILAPAQIVAKQTGFAQAEALVSILGRRSQTLDPAYLVENATVIAQYLLSNGWPVGNVDQAIGNISQSKEAYKLHFVRRLQDNEKAELARRKQNTKDLEEVRRTRQEQASVEVHPELRLSEKAKAHRDMMRRSAEKVTVEAPKPEYDYWKGRCDSAIQSIPLVMDRAEAQQIMDRRQGDSYETAHAFIMSFISRRQHERSLANPRMR